MGPSTQVSFKEDSWSWVCAFISRVQLHLKLDTLSASLFNTVDTESSCCREEAFPPFGKVWGAWGLLRLWGCPEGAREMRSEGLFVLRVLYEGNYPIQESTKT